MPTQVVHKTKYDWDACWLLYLAGAGLEELSEICKIPYQQLLNHSSQHRWGQRRPHAKTHAHKYVTTVLADRIQKKRVDHQNFVLDQLDKTQEHIAELEIGKTKEDVEAGKVRVGHLLNIVEQHDNIARRTLKLDEDVASNPLEQGFAMLVAFGKQQTIEHRGQPLVNEIMDVEVEKVVLPTANPEPQEAPETMPSATVVLPEQSDAFTGILRAFNGHVNSQGVTNDATKTASIPEDTSETGQIEPIKAMPTTLTFSAPKPLVNENPIE